MSDSSIDSDYGECQQMADLLYANHDQEDNHPTTDDGAAVMDVDCSDDDNLCQIMVNEMFASDDEDTLCQEIANQVFANENTDCMAIEAVQTTTIIGRKRGRQKCREVRGIKNSDGKWTRGPLQKKQQNLAKKLKRFNAKAEKLKLRTAQLKKEYDQHQNQHLQHGVSTPVAKQMLREKYAVELPNMSDEKGKSLLKTTYLNYRIWDEFHKDSGAYEKTTNKSIVNNALAAIER